MEKYRDGQRELHCVFVDLEKAYDRVPREELWYCMRKSGVAEKYVRVVQDMYERSRTVVRCAVGQTEEFKVEVGLHQGSALSPFLFAIVMDQLSEEVRQESPWTMMFADDIVICSESREQVEEILERWRFALERRGMKVSRSKTEYMCVNEREGSGTVRLQGEEVKKVQEFKYLGSTVQSNGECGKEYPAKKTAEHYSAESHRKSAAVHLTSLHRRPGAQERLREVRESRCSRPSPPQRAAMGETKIIYHLDDQETPYLVKVPVPAEEVTLAHFKQVLNKPNYKFFFKSMDDDFGGCPPEVVAAGSMHRAGEGGEERIVVGGRQKVRNRESKQQAE
ncbi:hypothetical protein QTP70_013317 [Hemibagrus guttatus]|uniref:ribonuclease H n=1 Tax=Hemibagrus guttatus TaxID=175788 RepID=A0AAE0RAY2_9TELE|nr:hypothetical protein QTP70_013317 [Hemibagrus guttatus]